MTSSRVLLLTSLCIAGIPECSVEGLALEGKACPCVAGYRCDNQTNRCERFDGNLDSGASAGAMHSDGAARGTGGGPQEGGAALACTPGERTCDGSTARTCNARGTAFDAAATDCSTLGARCIKGSCEVGLVAYWPFDEAAGNVAHDASGNGNDGTLINGGWAMRNGGGALELGSSGSYVDVGDTLNGLAVPFTVAAWVFVNTPDTVHELVSTDAALPHTGFWISQLPTSWQASYGDGIAASPRFRRTVSSNGPLPTGMWVHIAVVITGPTEMRLFMSGSEIAVTFDGTGGDMVHSTAPFLIGTRDFGGTSWDGGIDELRFYERALSASEIATLAEL
jgi:hypothetical protein